MEMVKSSLMHVIHKYKQNAKCTSGCERRQWQGCVMTLSSPGSAPALVNSQLLQIETALGQGQDVLVMQFKFFFAVLLEGCGFLCQLS